MKAKRIIDLFLILLLISLMLENHTGILIHEILGITLIVLFIIHHLLNKEYYKNIWKGKYNKLRTTYFIVDTLMLIMLFLMIISSFMISQKILAFIGLGNEYYGRILHIISGYSLYILCGIHLGLHYNSMIHLKKENKIVLNFFLILFACLFGINAFFKKKIIKKLTLKMIYPIYSKNNLFTNLIDYLSILILFMMIGYGLFNTLKLKRKKEKNE